MLHKKRLKFPINHTNIHSSHSITNWRFTIHHFTIDLLPHFLAFIATLSVFDASVCYALVSLFEFVLKEFTSNCEFWSVRLICLFFCTVWDSTHIPSIWIRFDSCYCFAAGCLNHGRGGQREIFDCQERWRRETGIVCKSLIKVLTRTECIEEISELRQGWWW